MAKSTLLALAAAAMSFRSGFALDNGRAVKPPMGWRSWNQYQTAINQEIMVGNFAALADRSRNVDGVPTSLCDIGYCDAGLDDAWQACGSYGPNGYTYHAADGTPQVNLASFPNFTAMNAFAHSLNLTSGWYHNNCMCKVSVIHQLIASVRTHVRAVL